MIQALIWRINDSNFMASRISYGQGCPSKDELITLLLVLFANRLKRGQLYQWTFGRKSLHH